MSKESSPRGRGAIDFHKTLDGLAEALGDSEGQSLAEIRNDIEEEGVDYAATMARLQQGLERQLKIMGKGVVK